MKQIGSALRPKWKSVNENDSGYSFHPNDVHRFGLKWRLDKNWLLKDISPRVPKNEEKTLDWHQPEIVAKTSSVTWGISPETGRSSTTWLFEDSTHETNCVDGSSADMTFLESLIRGAMSIPMVNTMTTATEQRHGGFTQEGWPALPKVLIFKTLSQYVAIESCNFQVTWSPKIYEQPWNLSQGSCDLESRTSYSGT